MWKSSPFLLSVVLWATSGSDPAPNLSDANYDVALSSVQLRLAFSQCTMVNVHVGLLFLDWLSAALRHGQLINSALKVKF